MKMKNLFWLIFLSLFALSSCGRKGALKYPGEQERPKFDKVIDEE
jgi:predicted small lipoprotein YifL